MQTRLGTSSDPLTPIVEPVPTDTGRRLRSYGWAILLLAGPVALFVFKIFPSLDQPVFHPPLGHLLITGAVTLLGATLALVVLHVAARAQDGRVYLVGMGFLSITSIMLVHSISTPDVLMAGRGLATAWSAILSLVFGSIFFALSGLPLSARLNTVLMRRKNLWLALYLAFWLAYAWVFLFVLPSLQAGQEGVAGSAPTASAQVSGDPHSGYAYDAYGDTSYGERESSEHHESDHLTEAAESGGVIASIISLETNRLLLVIIGLGCYAFAAIRHYNLYRRAPSQAGLAVTCGIVLFGEALVIQSLSTLYSSLFWLYHIEEFIGFGVISYAILVAYRRGQAYEGLIDSLMLASTRARIQAEYAHALDALIEALGRGTQPDPALRDSLRKQFSLTESQVNVLERAAAAIAQERQQRQELEQLNAVLRDLEQAKTQLTQMVVHDLKNPLTALIGFLEIMRMSELAPEQRSLLDSALRSGKNLSNLISDLLDIGRLEEGRLELERSLFSPRDLLHECAHEMSAWLAQEGKQVQIDASDDSIILHADLPILRRVVLNLFSNAIKHTSEGTQITLRAYRLEDQSLSPHITSERAEHLASSAVGTVAEQVIIEVEDNGPGIPSEHLERIFDKFSRVNSDQSGRQSSTGLGLTFCRLAVEAHGGTINVSSSIGVGTAFRIVLPVVDCTNQLESAPRDN